MSHTIHWSANMSTQPHVGRILGRNLGHHLEWSRSDSRYPVYWLKFGDRKDDNRSHHCRTMRERAPARFQSLLLSEECGSQRHHENIPNFRISAPQVLAVNPGVY